MSNVKASEGQWYSDRTTHDLFCVIAVDEIEGFIDVRDGYGDIDEFDLQEWSSMDLELCSPPDEPSWDDVDRDEAPPDSGAPSKSSPHTHHIRSSGTT